MPKSLLKPIIAVDIDDVLAANAEGFVNFSNQRWGTQLLPDDYTEHWAEIWKVDHDEVMKRRAMLFKEKVFLKHRIFDECKPVLKELSKKYKLVIVSSRNRSIQKDTIDWLDKNFAGTFFEYRFADMWDKPIDVLERLKLTKTELLGQIGADYLIDDQPKHCIAAARSGITALMFGDYRWTKQVPLEPNMVRVKNWSEVLEYFDAQG